MSAWTSTELSTERDFQIGLNIAALRRKLAGDELKGGVNTRAFAAAYIPLLRSTVTGSL